MLFTEVEARIVAAAERIAERYHPWLPFGGKYVRGFAAWLVGNVETIRHNWEAFHADGDAKRLIDFLVDYAKGNVPVPLVLTPFSGFLIEWLRAWLHAHEDIFREAPPA